MTNKEIFDKQPYSGYGWGITKEQEKWVFECMNQARQDERQRIADLIDKLEIPIGESETMFIVVNDLKKLLQ